MKTVFVIIEVVVISGHPEAHVIEAWSSQRLADNRVHELKRDSSHKYVVEELTLNEKS